MLKYADGVNSAHKGNIDKHTKSGGLHDWAKKKFSLNKPTEASETSNVNNNSSSSHYAKNEQPSIINSFYGPTTKGNYRRLIVTALHIALNERPLSDFPDLINLQKKNGLKFLKENPTKKHVQNLLISWQKL